MQFKQPATALVIIAIVVMINPDDQIKAQNLVSDETTVEVTENSVGVWKVWQNNWMALSAHFDGFIKYADKKTGKLVETHDYFANHVMMINRKVYKENKNRGCNRGFFRCLPAGTTLDISVSMHPPLKVKNNLKRISEETQARPENRFAEDADSSDPYSLTKSTVKQVLHDSLKTLKDSLSKLNSQLEKVKKKLIRPNERKLDLSGTLATHQNISNQSGGKSEEKLQRSEADNGPQWWQNIKANYKHTGLGFLLTILLFPAGIIVGALFESRRYIWHGLIRGKRKMWRGYDYMR